MKNRQIRLIIGILVGLVLFSSSLALLFYTKQDTKKVENVKNIEVYIANKSIKKGKLINIADIKKASVPATYIAFTPLMKSEIVGHYAAVKIFAKEPFRREKLLETKPQNVLVKTDVDTNGSTTQELKLKSNTNNKSDTLTLSLTRFQNLDTSLKAGDYIDIISAFPKENNVGFDTKYIALKVKINSFAYGSTPMKGVSIQIKETVTKKGLKTTQLKTVVADNVMLEMSATDIKNFFAAYYEAQELNSNKVYNIKKIYKGHLWMVKCSLDENAKGQKIKENLLIDHVKKYKHVNHSPQVSISYEN